MRKSGLQDRTEGIIQAPLIQNILSQLDGVFPFDEAVIDGTVTFLYFVEYYLKRFGVADTSHSALPKDVTFTSVESFGTSAWTVTGRVTAQRADGSIQRFFLKVGILI
jgi:protein-ribulosamine 3-kinase